MHRVDVDEHALLDAYFLGRVVKVERFGAPVQVLTLTYADGRRVSILAQDDDLAIGEENLPTC